MPRPICPPEAEVIGQVMLSYIDNIQADEIHPLLEKYGVANVKPDEWYRVKPWLDVINDLSKEPNFTTNMVAVGLKVAEYALMPPEMKDVTLEMILMGWNDHFYTNHRNGDLGSIVTEKISDKHFRMTHCHIYPDDLSYGLAYGFARIMLPKGATFKVWYADPENRLDAGGEETVMHVEWE